MAMGGEKDWCPIKVIGPCIAAPIVVVMAVCSHFFLIFVLLLFALQELLYHGCGADAYLLARCLASIHLRRMLRYRSWKRYVDFAIS